MTRSHVGGALLALGVSGGVAAGLALALTGGDAPPTRAAYVARVSTVCSRYGRQLDTIPPPLDLAAFGDVVDRVGRALPVLKAEESAIRAIRPPTTLKPRVTHLLTLSERSIGQLEKSLAAARRRDLPAVAQGLARFARARNEAKTLSRALGFRC